MKRAFPVLALLLSALLVTGCASSASQSSSSSGEPLENTYWKLTSLNGAPVEAASEQREAHLVLDPEQSRVAGSTGCNRLMGRYQVKGQALHFSGLASTRMACVNGMDTESRLLHALSETARWRVQGEQLEFYDEQGRRLAGFDAQPQR